MAKTSFKKIISNGSTQIKNLKDVIDKLSKIKKDKKKQLFFRGHTNKEYKLYPSLYRNENYYLSEDKIYKDIVMTCPQDFTNCRTTLEVLVKM